MTNQNKEKKTKEVTKKIIGITVASALAVTAAFTLGVNTSEALATSVANVPVLNQIAKVLTFREFNEKTDAADTTARIPEVQLDDKAFEETINKLIQAQMDEVLAESQKDAAEYKEAFLSTGGKEEDYTPVEVNIDYEVKGKTKDYLSFIINREETYPGISATYTYNIDLKGNEILTAQDLFGDDFASVLDAEIKGLMETKAAEGTVFFEEGKGFNGVLNTDGFVLDRDFYLTDDNAMVIAFPQYTVAPGSEGVVEFKIALPTAE